MFYGREHQKKSLLEMMAKNEQMISIICMCFSIKKWERKSLN